MDKLEMMKIFNQVCEVESFTKAAEVLNLPKATISTAVSRLEDHLGTRLLQRTTRKVSMTQDGQMFLERCKDLLADFDEAETMFQKNNQSIKGRIRVDMPTNMAKNVLIKKLPEFIKLYPDIEIELGCTDRRVDLIREGYDFVIRAGTLADSGLISKRIGEYSIVNCVSPAYIKKYGTPKKLEDLSKHYLIQYTQTFGGKPDGFEYFDGEKFANIKMKSMVTVNNAESYTAACIVGLGIIQAPLSGLKSLIKDGTLIEVLPKLKAEPMPVSIVYPHRRNLAQRVRVFMEWAQKEISEVLV